MGRSEPDGVSRLMLGGRQIALLEKEHRQFLGGVDIVRLERDEALQQSKSRLIPAGAPPHLIKDRERSGEARGFVQGL